MLEKMAGRSLGRKEAYSLVLARNREYVFDYSKGVSVSPRRVGGSQVRSQEPTGPSSKSGSDTLDFDCLL